MPSTSLSTPLLPPFCSHSCCAYEREPLGIYLGVTWDSLGSLTPIFNVSASAYLTVRTAVLRMQRYYNGFE